MKISIRVKIVGLGALIATLATGAGLFFGTFFYNNRARQNINDTIDAWLTNVDNDYRAGEAGDSHRQTLEDIYNYVNDIYKAGGDDPDDSEFEDFAKKRSYYMTKYRWVYPIDNMGMYYQKPEEIHFRDAYKEVVYGIRDGKVATEAITVYYCYFDEAKNRLIYLADEHSYTSNYIQEYHLPGSYIETTIRPTPTDKFYNFNINGNFGRCVPIGGVDNVDTPIAYYVVEYSYAASDAQTSHMFQLELLTLSLSSLALIAMFFVLSHFMITRNITKLSKSTARFTDTMKDNKELVVEDPHIKSRDEISDLSNNFIALETELIDYVDLVKKEAQEKERMNAELSVASKIQLEALPKSSFVDANLKLRAFIKTAKEVGGDFYDYFYLDDHRLCFTICDVSGKGVPAALFMMRGKELVKSNIRSGSSIKDAIYKANNDLIKNNDENLFITAFVGIINFEKHEIVYVNAGHEKPYIISNGKVSKLDGISNFVLGGEEDFVYQVERCEFNPGDRIFLFTDGLNEAINEKEEEFSYSRIESVLEENIDSSFDEIINNMNNKLSEFVVTDEVFDDVTMLLLEMNENKLHLEYDSKEQTIIDEIVDKFETKFSYLDQKFKSEVGIIIDELVNNIVSYSNVENLELVIDFSIEKDELVMVYQDNGVKFNPLTTNEKYLSEYSDDIEIGGFGVSLVKSLSQSQTYKYEKGHNVLTIKKSING